MIITHFILWFNIVSFSTGFASILIAYLSYLRYRKKVIVYYICFLISFLLILLEYLIRHIYSNVLSYDISDTIYLRIIVSNNGLILLFATLLTGIHHLLGFPITKIKKKIFMIIPIAYAIIVIMEFILILDSTDNYEKFRLLFYFEDLFIYSFMIYAIVLLFKNLPTFGDRYLKKAIIIFLFLSAATISYEILADVFEYRDNNNIIIHGLHLTIFFFLINFLSIFFSVKYLNQPAYFANNILTKYFKEKFNITKREGEIVSLLIEGYTNKVISEKLFISYKTVESHLYSCYKKTEVKNRIQLVNLVQTNKVE